MNKIGAEELLGEENAERKTGEYFQRGSANQNSRRIYCGHTIPKHVLTFYRIRWSAVDIQVSTIPNSKFVFGLSLGGLSDAQHSRAFDFTFFQLL